MKIFVRSLAVVTLVVVALFAVLKPIFDVDAQTYQPGNYVPGDLIGQAWSSNIGWVDFGNAGKTYGVKMQTSGDVRNLSGYAWSSNIGWVNFNNTECPANYSGNCQPRVEWGTNGGPAVLVKGFARACSVFANSDTRIIPNVHTTAENGCDSSKGLKSPEDRGGWDGFISLGDSKPTDSVAYGAKFNTTTGGAFGLAWGSEVVGWLDFSGVKVIPSQTPTCPDGSPKPSSGICPVPPNNGPLYCPDGGLAPNNDLSQCPEGGAICTDGSPAPQGDITKCPTPENKCSDGSLPPNGDMSKCPTTPGICTNIPIDVQQALQITETTLPPHYIKKSNGQCACERGYVLNAQYQCVKPVYIEH